MGTLREVEVVCCWTGGYVAGVTLSFAVSSAVNLKLPKKEGLFNAKK